MPHIARRLAKARSEAKPRCALPRMIRTRSDSRLLRSHPRATARLRITHSLRTLVNAPKRIRWQIRNVCLFVVVVLLIVFMLTEPPDSHGRNASGVRQRIEAIRGERRNSMESPLPKPSLPLRRRKNRTLRQAKVNGQKRPTNGFKPVKRLARLHPVDLGTFPYPRRVGIMTIALIPAPANRFNTPWHLPQRVEPLSFSASGNRILFSTLTRKSSDSIGYALSVLNAELSTALNLGISYTHRIGTYTFTKEGEPNVVEDLVGFGVGEVPRLFIEKEVCVVALVSKKNAAATDERCPLCATLQKNKYVDRIVQVPAQLSYGCVSCHSRQVAVRRFLDRWGSNNTLFQMVPDRCEDLPGARDFTLSQRYIYWKYWDLHGEAAYGQMPKRYVKMEGLNWAVPHSRRSPVQLMEHELNIAVHVRGEGISFERRQSMISSQVFAKVIRQSMDAVRSIGGVYARMPVAVIVYSDVKAMHLENWEEQAHIDHGFYDSDGTIRNATRLHSLLVPDSEGLGNKTHSCRKRSSLFPSGVRVELRGMTDLSAAFHEMASADIFIGGDSDWSQYAIRLVSRGGLQLLPGYLGGGLGCCVVRFNARSGWVRKKRSAMEFWRMFVMSNERSAWRAVKEARRDKLECQSVER